MTRETLLGHIRTGDDVIKGIQKDQLLIVESYIKSEYNIVKDSIILVNDAKIKVHHFSFTDGGKKINMHYQLVKANGKAESTIFTKLLGNNLKIETNEIP